MKIGIVGSEQAKFTPLTEQVARLLINTLISRTGATTVVSGACHLGGVDIFAKEEAINRCINVIEYKPKKLQWEGGYKQRNILIAKDSDECYCITLAELPPSYTGMRFTRCYHCNSTSHVKSGGCWTVRYAERLVKPIGIYAITPDGAIRIER